MNYGKRFALPNSRILVHQPSSGVSGQASDIDIQAREVIRMRECLAGILSRSTGQPLDKIQKDTDRDFIMTAEQALGYGLIDEVMEKRD